MIKVLLNITQCTSFLWFRNYTVRLSKIDIRFCEFNHRYYTEMFIKTLASTISGYHQLRLLGTLINCS